MNFNLLKRLGLVAIAFSMFAPAAMAAPVKDAAGFLYVDGLTANGQATVEYPGATKVSSIASNACGYLVIRNTAGNKLESVTGITINGTAASVPAPSTIDTIPRCTNGVADADRTANFRTAAGDIVFVGQSPLTQYSVGFEGLTLTRRQNVNACGFIRLADSAAYPLSGTITVNGTSITPSTVTVGNPPVCRNNVLYMPQ